MAQRGILAHRHARESRLSYTRRMAKDKKKSKASDAPLGSGERFAKLSSELGEKGADDPDALAAWIGRRKYGAERFAKLGAKGKKG